MSEKRRNIFNKGLKSVFIPTAVFLFIAVLQSWSRPEALRKETGLFSSSAGAVAAMRDSVRTEYQKKIDSLAGLNLSLDSLRRMGLSESILFSIDSVYKLDSIA